MTVRIPQAPCAACRYRPFRGSTLAAHSRTALRALLQHRSPAPDPDPPAMTAAYHASPAPTPSMPLRSPHRSRPAASVRYRVDAPRPHRYGQREKRNYANSIPSTETRSVHRDPNHVNCRSILHLPAGRRHDSPETRTAPSQISYESTLALSSLSLAHQRHDRNLRESTPKPTAFLAFRRRRQDLLIANAPLACPLPVPATPAPR